MTESYEAAWRAISMPVSTLSALALAGELLDQGAQNVCSGSGSSMVCGETFNGYLAAYKAGMHRRAHSWSIHPYYSANTTPADGGKDSNWNTFVMATDFRRAQVIRIQTFGSPRWVHSPRLHPRVRVFSKATPPQHTLDSMNHILDLAKKNNRVKRFLYYLDVGNLAFDSGLRDYNTLALRQSLYCIYWEAINAPPTGQPPPCPNPQ